MNLTVAGDGRVKPEECKPYLTACTWPDCRCDARSNAQIELVESDPTGKAANEPGAKLDAGKTMPSLILSAMPRALMAVAEVGTFGARKYSRDGWLSVENGVVRYTDAMDRHRLYETIDGLIDPQSNLLHAAHLAWNALARLELMLREQEKANAAN